MKLMLCLVGENGMKWVKILETNTDGKKVLKKIWGSAKSLWWDLRRNWGWENVAFHLKSKVWSLAHDVKNGMEERMKFLKNYL